MTYRRSWLAFRRDASGVAAAEFAIWLFFLVPATLNIVDLGVYIFRKMQVQSAAQMGAQAAYLNCSAPLTCNVDTQVDAAIQSTSLGTLVTRVGSVSIAQYCPASNAGASTNSLVAQNSTCSSVTSTGTTPGYYAKVTVTYTANPIFPGVTVASLLSSTITQTSWSRIT